MKDSQKAKKQIKKTKRRRAAGSVVKGEERFRALIENAFDGITVVGADGRVLYQSTALDRILGYKPKERVGGGVLDLIHPEDLPAVKETFSRFVKNPGEVVTMSLRFKHKDGSWRWMECRSNNLLQDPAVGGMVTNYRDITERKQSEEALRESEGKYKALVEQALEGVVIAQGLPLRLVFANSTMKTLLGYTVKELLSFSSEKLQSLIYPDDRALFFGRYRDRLQGKSVPSRYEFRAVKKDGTVIWVEISSRRIEYYGELAIQATFADIAERKEAEEALLESEQKLRTLFKVVGVGITILDGSGKVVDVNNALLKLSGYSSKKEVVGRNGLEFVSEQDLELATRALSDAITKGKTISTEITLLRKDGSEYLCEASGTALLDASGELAGLIIVQRDITERKRMEATLVESEQKLRAMFESVEDAVTLTDLKGRILDVNKAGLRIFGLNKKEEAIGKEGFDFIADKCRDAAMKDMAKLFEKKKLGPVEYTLQTADGREFEVESSNALLRDASGNPVGIVSINRDITERKRAEEALRESEQRFRAIVENSSEVIFSLDTQGRITYISPAIEHLSGYTLDEVTGTSFARYIVPEDLPGLQASLERTLAGHREPYQFRVLCKDGMIRTVLSSSHALMQQGHPVGLTGVISDITERQWLEDVLRFSEDKYRRLVETLNEGIWQIDKDAITTYVNPRMAELLGYEIGEMIGVHLFDFMDEQWVEIGERLLKRRELGISEQHEFEFIRKDGKRIRATLSTSPIFDEDGEYNGAIAAVQDVTERKRAEEALQKSEEKYRLVADNATDVIILVDMNLKPIYISPSYSRMLGYSVEEAMTGQLEDKATSASIEKLMALFKEGLIYEKQHPGESTGTTLELETIHKNGSIIPAEMIVSFVRDSTGALVGVLGIMRDITDRKRAESELRIKESALASSINALTLIDLDGIITYVNDSFLRLWGYDDAGEVLGRHITEMWRRGKQASSILEAALSRGGSSGELEAVRKDGSSFIAQISSSLVSDEAGKPVCALGSYIDVTERRRAEESLRKERDRAQTYLDVAEVMMVVVDADEKVSLINKKGCEVLGCKTKEVIGRNWFDCFTPESSRERTRGLFRKVVSGQVELAEYYESGVVTASGEERIIAWHNSIIVSEDGKIAGTLGSGVDITDRKRAEEERGNLMQQLNQRVKELDCLYGISNVLARQNISTEEIFNAIVVMIPQALRYPEIACARICLGDEEFSTKNFRGTEWKLSQDIVPHGERAGCVEVYYLEGRPETEEGVFSAEERNLIDAVAKRLSEAIERKEAKQALRESEERLHLMFDTVSDGIIVSDVEGRITEANKAAIRIHGLDRKEELIGRHGLDFIAEKDRARAREDLKKGVEQGQVVDTAVYSFVDVRGKEFKMEYRTSILYNGSGRLLGFLCAMRDITGRRWG